MSSTEPPLVVLFQFLARLRYKIHRELERLINWLLARHLSRSSNGSIFYRAYRNSRTEYSGRWRELSAASGRLTILVVTFRQPVPLDCLLSSLRCQTLQNFNVVVLHDGKDDETRFVVERHRDAGAGNYEYIETATRFNDYGHTLRDIGIQRATGEFVLITNGDNYYSPRFVEFVFDAIDEGNLDLALWDIVHSHSNAGDSRNASNSSFQSYPVPKRIDIGAFCVKTEIAQSVGFRDRSHDGDATYFSDILEYQRVGMRIGKIQKVLMVHN